MKLLDAIKFIIIEQKKFPKLKLNARFDGIDFRLLSSFHQWFERHGDEDYDEVKDIFFNKTSKSKKYRVGVPDDMIIDTIKKKISKIEKSFQETTDKRIIFVKKRKDNEDEVDFDFMEFILEKEGDDFTIITSAFSKDGFYLSLGFPVKTKTVMLEKVIKVKYKVIYLN